MDEYSQCGGVFCPIQRADYMIDFPIAHFSHQHRNYAPNGGGYVDISHQE